MKVTRLRGKKQCTIVLEGNVDRIHENPMDFYKALVDAADCDKIILDLSNARFFSTMFISQLIKFRNNYIQAHKKLTISRPEPDIHDILKIACIDKLYKISL